MEPFIMRLKKKFFIPSLADMLFLSIFLYLSFSQGSQLLNDCDTGYHIRAGEWILKNHSIPSHDMFSFHAPAISWTAHEWLSEVIMAVIHQVSGLTGVVVFFTFLLALTFYLLFIRIRNTGANIIVTVFIVLLATAASQIHWLARPHIFSLVLLMLWDWVLEEHRNGKRNRLHLLPILMLLWVNLHGGYLSGFMLLGIYLTGELPAILSRDFDKKRAAMLRAKQLLVTTAFCVPVACINPYGYHILFFPFTLVSNKLIMDNVAEFMSPNFHEPSPFKYLLLLLVTVLAASKNRLCLKDLLLILVFLNMSLYSARYITLFAIIAAPIIVLQIDTLLMESQNRITEFVKTRAQSFTEIDRVTGGILWPIMAFIAVAGAVNQGAIRFDFDPKKKPIEAVRFIEKTNITGNMFNNDEFGDYLIYACWPRYKVFFDGRSDMYGTDRLQEYLRVRSFKAGWEATLDKYKINWIFFDTDSALVRFLQERNDWKMIYQDKVASIFVKNAPQNMLLIGKFRSARNKP
jgi:hypothetical protein